MHAPFVLGTTAFLICLAITPLCRDLFRRAGLVDRPDSERKFHLRAVPRIGGVPIALAYAGAFALVFFFNPGGSKIYVQHEQLFHALLPGAIVIFATGLLDDIRSLKPRHKLIGQLVAAILSVSLGARLSIPHMNPWIGGALSVGWLIACTNAVNLIDGMDGLATGVGLLATISTLLVALLSGNHGLALATAPLAGCLLAFLRYNFSPASVFLGDCGSLTIGFVLGCFGLIWSQHTDTMLGMAAPLMALSLPLIDVVLAIGRRYLRDVPIFKGDRGHIHHRVLALGLSTRSAALLLYAVCGIFASLAILESFGGRGFGWPVIVIFCCLVLVGIDRLGYVEFTAARKTILHTFRRRSVQDHIFLEELQHLMAQARTIEEWWGIVRNSSHYLHFASVHMELNGCTYKEQFIAGAGAPACRIYLRLADGGHLNLTRMQEKAPPRHMMTILHRLQSAMDEKFSSEPVSVATNAAVVTSTAA